MAFEMDEMNRRSQERQKRQEARLKKERRNRIRLLAALGVLVACGLLIFFTSVAPEQKPATPTETTTEPVETEPVQMEVKPGETGQQDGFQPTTVITFAAA